MTRRAIGITKIRSNNQIDRFDIEQVTGPLSIDGYCPLYTTSRAAVAASPFPDMVRPGEKTVGYHVHVLNGTRYYMPNGLKMGETQFHGDCPGIIPSPGDATEFDPDAVPRIIVAGGKLDFPYKPSLVQDGSKYSMYYISQGAMGLTEDIEAYKNETDEEFRERIQNYLAGKAVFNSETANTLDRWIDLYGEDPTVVRSTYLNEKTTGWILLDWEKPINLGGLLNVSNADLTWWVKGIIRRINILREFLPNAKFGIWRLGQGLGPTNGNAADVNQYRRRQLRAAEIEYQGKNLFETIDFLSPTFYQYEYYVGTEAYTRVVDGTRVQRSKDVCDAMFEKFGKLKSVVPILKYNYADSIYGAIESLQLNSIEISYMKDYASHWAFWFVLSQGLYDYYYRRDQLTLYYEEFYLNNTTEAVPLPVEPSLESY